MSAPLPPSPAPSDPVPCALCLALWAYVYNLARWLDQGLNVLTGGDPRQTVSSRLGRAQLGGKWWADWLCAAIGFVWRDPRHCLDAVREADNAMEVVDIDGCPIP
jgi:hypothetical protein